MIKIILMSIGKIYVAISMRGAPEFKNVVCNMQIAFLKRNMLRVSAYDAGMLCKNACLNKIEESHCFKQ
jgi:hypothetical protein